MKLNRLEVIVLFGVIALHVLFFLLGLIHSDDRTPPPQTVLEATLIPPAPIPKPTPPAPEPEKKPPPKPPKLLSIAPEKKKSSSPVKEAPKAQETKQKEAPTPEKTDQSSSATETKTATPPSPSPSKPANTEIGVSGGSVALNQLVMVYKPDTEVFYPRISKDIGEQGVVGIIMQINESGNVYGTSVHRSSGYPRLDRAAAELASRIRFQPYLINGTPSKVSAGISIKFQLSR